MSDTKDTVQDAINVEVNRNCTQMLFHTKQAQICRTRSRDWKTIIDVASSRGAFKPNEMMSVGQVYGKLEAFLSAVSQQQAKQAPTTTEAGPAKGA